jgi:hypothetical protein
MSTQKDPLEVIVQGGPIETNTLVFGIVQNALQDAGFTDVSVHSPQGNVECDFTEMPSLLDVVRANRPHLFDTPLRVTQNAHADDVLLLSTDDPGKTGIAKIVYGGDQAAVIITEEPEEIEVELDDFAERPESEDIAY